MSKYVHIDIFTYIDIYNVYMYVWTYPLSIFKYNREQMKMTQTSEPLTIYMILEKLLKLSNCFFIYKIPYSLYFKKYYEY